MGTRGYSEQRVLKEHNVVTHNLHTTAYTIIIRLLGTDKIMFIQPHRYVDVDVLEFDVDKAWVGTEVQVMLMVRD